jgi:predicted MFS family arabinose efflux permease
MQSAQAVGTMVATVTAGVLAATASWRVAMAVPAVVAGVLVAVLRSLPEPVRQAGPSGGARAVLRSRWAWVVLALALVEGAALLGFLAYLAPALESSGLSPLVAGGVVALYGVGLLLASRVVRRIAGRGRAATLVAAGSAVLALAYGAAAVDQGVVGVGVAAFLVGVAWAPLHSTMQSWATQVMPTARATMVSGYATMLFVGSGLATWAVAPLAGQTRWTAAFLVGAALAVATGVSGGVARARYDARSGPVGPVGVGGTSG